MVSYRTQKQFEQDYASLIEQITQRKTFAQSSEQAKTARKQAAAQSLWAFARHYLPDYVPLEPGKFHAAWEAHAQVRNEPLQVQAFRGAGKSTFFTLIAPLHAILHKHCHFMLFASSTEDKAQNYTTRLLLELLYNPRIKHDYGALSIAQNQYSQKRYTVRYDHHTVHVRAISIGQDPRGLVHGPHRPDFVRLDDIQTIQKSRSRKYIDNAIEWIAQSLIPALQENYSMILVSTPLHASDVTSLLTKGTEERKALRTYKYPALDASGKPTWRSNYPRERLERIKAQIGSLNYAQEYMLIPKQLDEAVFRRDWIRYYDTLPKQPDLVIGWVDPSAKGAASHDYKALGIAGIYKGSVYLLATWIRRATISTMIDAMYTLCEQYNPSIFYVEDNGGQSLLEELFISEWEKREIMLPYKMITNTMNKHQRIEQTLSPAIERGVVYFNKDDSDTKLLLEQLLQFPEGDHDDGPDMLEGLVRMLLQYRQKRGQQLPQIHKMRSSARLLHGFK